MRWAWLVLSAVKYMFMVLHARVAESAVSAWLVSTFLMISSWRKNQQNPQQDLGKNNGKCEILFHLPSLALSSSTPKQSWYFLSRDYISVRKHFSPYLWYPHSPWWIAKLLLSFFCCLCSSCKAKTCWVKTVSRSGLWSDPSGATLLLPKTTCMEPLVTCFLFSFCFLWLGMNAWRDVSVFLTWVSV